MNLEERITEAFQDLWVNTIAFVPDLLVALVVLIIGVLIASLLGRAATKLMGLTRIDNLVETSGVRQKSEDLGMKFSISGLVGWIVKWFFILLTFIVVADVLQLHQVNEFLRQVIFYVPNIVAAVIILTIGFVGGEFLSRVVRRALEATSLPGGRPELLANVARYAVIIFSIMAALVQLQVVPQLIMIAFGGLVLALALAFGLGGREHAARFLDDVTGRPRS